MELYKTYIKRAIDIMASGGALLVLCVPLAAVTVWLHFANKGAGAFFLQERPGKNGKIFKVVKFKTMTDERDANGDLLPNEIRLTKVGRFVRAASIDELPQFINVFKGDMSLIGPRPLLTWFLPLYDKEQARRHEVRPGITGWAQVNGRNNSTYSQKFKDDVWYVDHLSFVTDCKIVWKTIKNVLGAKDIGNGLQNEVDDLGWWEKRKEAQELFEKYYRNRK
jgi:undecaprenyl phosphate N,N'-diacetylbacillosamine 1-phosphate transferase